MKPKGDQKLYHSPIVETALVKFQDKSSRSHRSFTIRTEARFCGKEKCTCLKLSTCNETKCKANKFGLKSIRYTSDL